MKIKKSVVAKASTPSKSTKATPAPAPASTKAAKGKPGASATPAAEPVEKKMGVNFGVSSGMRVMAYQDWTLAHNDEKTRPDRKPGQRTDEELAADWRAEFPESRAVKNGRINAEIVRGVRSLYNRGTGGHGTQGVRHESKPWMIDDKGHRIQGAYTRTRRTEQEEAPTPAPKTKATPASPQAVAKSKAQIVPPKGGKTAKRRAA